LVSCRYLNAELLVASLYASRKSCDLVTLSRFYVVFHSPKTNVKLVPQIDVAWRACHAAPAKGSAVSPHSCPLNTKLSPDAELHCCALPVILPSSFFSAHHSCLLPAFIRRTSGHYLQTFRSLILVLPISCSFPSYSYCFRRLPESRVLCFVSYGSYAFLFFGCTV
jgi:hypothetical protein